LATNRAGHQKESAIEHEQENAAKAPRAYNGFSANGNNPLKPVSQSRCTSRTVVSSLISTLDCDLSGPHQSYGYHDSSFVLRRRNDKADPAPGNSCAAEPTSPISHKEVVENECHGLLVAILSDCPITHLQRNMTKSHFGDIDPRSMGW
jgi:hypothetical protein